MSAKDPLASPEPDTLSATDIYIEELLAIAPALTAEQKGEISSLLSGVVRPRHAPRKKETP